MPRIHPHVRALLEETGEVNPVQAVRARARAIVSEFVEVFGEEPPFNMEALASFRGLLPSDDQPRYSPDSEIVPQDGGVVLRVNRDRPVVRQRFSIGHEVGHTLFPGYELDVRCRKPLDSEWADPEDQLEWLCDVAASEFVLPSPWFDRAVAGIEVSATGIRDLARDYHVSAEAAIRRLLEYSVQPIAALFCSWKLKPTQIRQQERDEHQGVMFDLGSALPDKMLRVDYSVVNEEFRSRCCAHLPRDKSIPFEGPVSAAARTQEPQDGVLWMDLGTTAMEFHVHVLPRYTLPTDTGPDGACSVVAVIRPQKRRS